VVQDGLSPEEASKYVEDLVVAKKKIEDRVIKTAYLKSKFGDLSTEQIEEMVSNAASKESLSEYLGSENIVAPDGLWEELERNK